MCSEISTYEKTYVKLKNMLNVLVKECKEFLKSEIVVSMRTSIPKIAECYPFLINCPGIADLTLGTSFHGKLFF